MTQISEDRSRMRITVLVAAILPLTLTLSTAASPQTLDTAKLDHLLGQLADKNKGIGRLTLAREGRVTYDHSFGEGKTDVDGKTLLKPDSKYKITRTRCQRNGRCGRDRVNDGRFGDVHSRAVRAQAGFPEQPHADDHDEGR
jgi:hypothetical protein